MAIERFATESGDPRDSAHVVVGHRADIEGLRAIAVVSVVLYHCRIGWFAGGYIGVGMLRSGRCARWSYVRAL